MWEIIIDNSNTIFCWIQSEVLLYAHDVRKKILCIPSFAWLMNVDNCVLSIYISGRDLGYNGPWCPYLAGELFVTFVSGICFLFFLAGPRSNSSTGLVFNPALIYIYMYNMSHWVTDIWPKRNINIMSVLTCYYDVIGHHGISVVWFSQYSIDHIH